MPKRLALLLALLLIAWAPSVQAHAIGLSTGEYRTDGASLVAKVAFARGEVAALARGIDQNHDGHLTALEVQSSRNLIEEKILKRIVVRTGAASCTPTLTDAGLTEEDGILLTGRWACSRADVPFDVELALLDDLARGHRHVARAVGPGGAADHVLFGEERTFAVPPNASAAGSGLDSAGAGKTPSQAPGRASGSGWSFFVMGIEHILTGYDHLVFIVGLVLARARARSLLTIVTAFTIAHSISLALAVLDVWSPSSRIVEPAIALSIAYVGIENFFVADASKR